METIYFNSFINTTIENTSGLTLTKQFISEMEFSIEKNSIITTQLDKESFIDLEET